MKHGIEQKEMESAENLRRYYLQTMGIQSWVLKQSTQPELTAAAKAKNPQPPLTLSALQQQIEDCTRCALSADCNQHSFGMGDPAARVMLICLAPDTSDFMIDSCERVQSVNNSLMSTDENTLLTRMLQAIEVDINDVFISSLLKCHVPASHTILPSEVIACSQYLNQQIALIQPAVLFVMGQAVAQYLLNSTADIDTLRTQQHAYAQRPVVVSYAVNDLRINPAEKRKAWADLKKLQTIMNPLR